MKKIFVAVGSTASDAVIELAKRCRDENLDKDGMLARDFKYITMDTDLRVKERLERLYPDATRVCGIHIQSEPNGSATLESILALRADWKDRLQLDPFGAYGIRRKTAGTRTWVSALRQVFLNWRINLQEEQLEILVVGTACGATCTGMYWDVAGCLRSWSTQHTTVCGLVCLPDLDQAPIRTPEGIYPIPRNFCAFMQDMRQIALLNSLRNSRNGTGGHYFKPVSFKEIQSDGGSNRWEDSLLPLFDTQDARLDTSRLPVDALFFLPPRVDDAKKNFADHLFVYAAIYHYSGPGGQADMGNAANRGGIFGGLDLAVATSPLYNAIKRAVQSQWQNMRSSFLGDKGQMDEADKERIAELIRPPKDLIPTILAPAIQESIQWFKDWVSSIQSGKKPAHELDEILTHLRDRIEHAGIENYMREKPIPFTFFGAEGFARKIRDDQGAWGCVARELGSQATIRGLEEIYLQVCEEIKVRGGATAQDRDKKTEDMANAMKVALRTFAKSSKGRTAKMAVKAFGQRSEILLEAAKNFTDYADAWFKRLVDIYLMYFLSRKLPSKNQLDREIGEYSEIVSQGTSDVVQANTYAVLEAPTTIRREAVLDTLFSWLISLDMKVRPETNKEKCQERYEEFVSGNLSRILEHLSQEPAFDMVPFVPRFSTDISGYSEVFRRGEDACNDPTQVLVKHICMHAGNVQKPTNESVWRFSPSFKSLRYGASNNDAFDPFANPGEENPQAITRAPDRLQSTCYFGPLNGVPTTFLRMWLGVLALDKSLPELMEQVFRLNKRTGIQDNSMPPETQKGDFVRLMNLRESVELGVVLGYLTKKMKEQDQRMGGVHLKEKKNNRELVTWGQDRVSAFWEDADLKRVDVRTIKNLLVWLRELNGQEETERHVRFWNEKDWSPLTENTFMFDNLPEYKTALDDLEQYLCTQVEVTFDPYRAG